MPSCRQGRLGWHFSVVVISWLSGAVQSNPTLRTRTIFLARSTWIYIEIRTLLYQLCPAVSFSLREVNRENHNFSMSLLTVF